MEEGPKRGLLVFAARREFIHMRSIRELILDSRSTVGSWLQLSDPAMAEMMVQAGFDWLCIDMEHTTTSIENMGRLVRVIDMGGIPPFVRLSSHEPTLIKRSLDSGVRGIIAPMVNTAAEAKRIVDAAYYPPRGQRGVGLSRAQGYGLDFEQYRTGAAEDIVIFAQIEHIDAVGNLEAILAVDGIDGFFVGPYDLSGSVGHPGDFEHPMVKSALEEVARHIEPDGPVAGLHVVDPDVAQLRAALDRGYRFVALASEMLILSHRLGALRDELPGARQ